MIKKEQTILFPRKTKTDFLRIRIPAKDTYRYLGGFCTWEELLKTEGIKLTDIVDGFSWDEERAGLFSYDNTEETVDIPIIVVKRSREETDEEYLERMKQDAVLKKSKEEREKLEYLRLKAKFEEK